MNFILPIKVRSIPFKWGLSSLSTLLLIFWYLLLSYSTCLSSETITLNNKELKSPLNHFDLYEDHFGNLLIDQVSSEPISNRFISKKAQRLNIGFTSSAWWIRFKVPVHSSSRLIELAKANLDEVDLYIPTEKGWIQHLAGSLRPPEARQIKSRTFVFQIPDSYAPDEYFFVRLKSHTSLNLEIKIWDASYWQDRSATELVIFGLLFGAILSMAVYNFFIYIISFYTIIF